MSDTPAGWYPDSSTPGTLRYWNGDAWTEHVAPAQPAAQPVVQPVVQPMVQPTVQPLAPPLVQPKKSRAGLFIGLGAGIGGLLLIIAVIVVMALVVVPRLIPAAQYDTDDLSEVATPQLPNGFETSDEVVIGEVEDSSAVLDEATPAECTDLYYTAPESNADKDDYDIVVFDDATDNADSSLTAYARAFRSEDEAKDFVAHTAAMIRECAGGYSIPFVDDDGEYTTESVEPFEVDTDLDATGWTEPEADADYPDFRAVDLRLDNMVVRATCVGSSDDCSAFWQTVVDQMKGIEIR